MSESIESILDGCLEEMEKGHGVEECLGRYPNWREELAPLLRTATRLRSAPEVKPSTAFRRGAATRMANPIRAREMQRPVTTLPGLRYIEDIQRSFQERRKFVMPALSILLLVTSLVGGGTAYASQDALPGDLLYGVKMLVEDARLLINADEIGDAELHLEFATERLEEAATLVAQGRPDFVEDLVAGYAGEMEAALAPLADGVDDGEMSLLERLEQSLAHHLDVLEGLWLSDQVPDAAKSAIAGAMLASDVVEQVLDTVGGAVDHEPPAIEPPAIEPPPVDVEPPPVDIEPPPVDVEPPPVDIEPPPVDVEPPPVDVEPPPVDVEPPPVDVEPPPVDVEPPPVDVEPPPVDVEPPTEIPGPPGETPGSP